MLLHNCYTNSKAKRSFVTSEVLQELQRSLARQSAKKIGQDNKQSLTITTARQRNASADEGNRQKLPGHHFFRSEEVHFETGSVAPRSPITIWTLASSVHFLPTLKGR